MEEKDKTRVVQVDERALDEIKDTARRIFSETSPHNLHITLFEALHHYLQTQGVSPNFKVTAKR